jgi:hypothetical protein
VREGVRKTALELGGLPPLLPGFYSCLLRKRAIGLQVLKLGRDFMVEERGAIRPHPELCINPRSRYQKCN